MSLNMARIGTFSWHWGSSPSCRYFGLCVPSQTFFISDISACLSRTFTKTHEHKKNASAFAKFQCRAFAIVKLPVRLLSLFNAGVPTCILALAIATFYEFALNKLGLAAWIITAPRVNVISQNKEGILSFIGYLAIFLLGRATGYYLLPQAASLNTMLYPQTSKEYFNTLKNISASSGLEKRMLPVKEDCLADHCKCLLARTILFSAALTFDWLSVADLPICHTFFGFHLTTP